MLRPEVKTTLDKVMYQLDLVKNSLGVLSQRINNNELQLQEMQEFIRQEDINYVSITSLLFTQSLTLFASLETSTCNGCG